MCRYGTPGTYSQGPTIASAKASGGKITLTFNNTGSGGLEVKQAVSKLKNGSAWEVCMLSMAETETTGVDACGLLDTVRALSWCCSLQLVLSV